MAYQHYIPASYLANFAAVDHVENRRKNMVFIGDKLNPTNPIREDIVGHICGENGFYAVQKQWKKSIDAIWNYEGDLHNAIEKLVNHNVNAETWLKTLVPFAVCLFVRSKDFNKRFTNRILSMGLSEVFKENEQMNIDQARLFELQRLLCPILTAKWIVLEAHGEDNVIINDVGFMPYRNFFVGHQGFAIPLDKRHILSLATRKDGRLLQKKANSWEPFIEYIDLPKNNHISFNKLLARFSTRYIIGDSKEIVEKNLTFNKQFFPGLEPIGQFNFSGHELAAFEFSWHRLVSFLDGFTSNPEKTDFEITWDSVNKFWQIPVLFPTNLMDFPPIYSRMKDQIHFECYDPTQYFTYCSIRNLSSMNYFKEVVSFNKSELSIVKDADLRRKNFFLRQFALSELHKPIQSLIELFFHWKPDKDFYFQRAVCLMDLKLTRYALADFHKSCKLDFDNERSLLNIAVCLSKLEMTDTAIAIFNFLSDSKEKELSNAALLNLANIYRVRGSMDSALREFKKIEKKYLSDQNCVLYYTNFIEVLFSGKKYSQIPDLIKKLEEIQPENNAVYFFRKEYADVTNNPAQFLDSTEKLLKIRIPRSLSALLHFQRSQVYLYKEDFTNAIKENKTALIKNYFKFQYHAHMSELFMFTTKYFKAIVENIIALCLSKNDGRLYNSLGVIFFTKGNVKFAKHLYKISIHLLKKSEEIVRPYRNLMRCYLENEELPLAEQLIEKIRRIEPNSNDTKLIMAQYHIYKNDYEQAMDILPKVTKVGSGYREILLIKAIIYKKIKRNNEYQKVFAGLSKKKILEFTLSKYRREIAECQLKF